MAGMRARTGIRRLGGILAVGGLVLVGVGASGAGADEGTTSVAAKVCSNAHSAADYANCGTANTPVPPDTVNAQLHGTVDTLINSSGEFVLHVSALPAGPVPGWTDVKLCVPYPSGPTFLADCRQHQAGSEGILRGNTDYSVTSPTPGFNVTGADTTTSFNACYGDLTITVKPDVVTSQPSPFSWALQLSPCQADTVPDRKDEGVDEVFDSIEKTAPTTTTSTTTTTTTTTAPPIGDPPVGTPPAPGSAQVAGATAAATAGTTAQLAFTGHLNRAALVAGVVLALLGAVLLGVSRRLGPRSAGL
jgi:hypothetical protein